MNKDQRVSRTLEQLHELARSRVMDYDRAMLTPRPVDTVSGQIWKTRINLWSPSGTLTADRAYFVLILKGCEPIQGEKAVQVAVLHPESIMASQYDLLLPDSLPVVGGWMISFWNTGLMLERQLDAFIGVTLDRAFLKWCEAIWAKAMGVEQDDYPSEPLPIGQPIFSSADTRLEFQDQVLEEASVLWKPAMELIGSEESEIHATPPVHVPVTRAFLERLQGITGDPANVPALVGRTIGGLVNSLVLVGMTDSSVLEQLREIEGVPGTRDTHTIDIAQGERWKVWITGPVGTRWYFRGVLLGTAISAEPRISLRFFSSARVLQFEALDRSAPGGQIAIEFPPAVLRDGRFFLLLDCEGERLIDAQVEFHPQPETR